MATEALREALTSPQISIDCIDSYSLIDQVFAKTSRSLYENLNSFTGPIFDYLTEHKIIFPDEEKVGKNLAPIAKKFEDYLLKRKPNLVISTQPFPAILISHFKKKHGLNLSHMVVVTDFNANPYWAVSKADYYTVASQKAANDLKKEGIAANKIKIVGIPLRKCFADKPNKNYLRKKYSIPNNLRVVLIFSGSLRMGFYTEVSKKLKQIHQRFTDKSGFYLLILTGSNANLEKKIEKEVSKKNLKNIKVLGFTDKMNELLAITDLLITKPGGLICAEAIKMEVPLLLTGPYFVEGKTNTDFLVKNKAAVRLKSSEDIYLKIKRLLKNKELLSQMAKNAKRISKPRATRDIAKLVSKFLEG